MLRKVLFSQVSIRPPGKQIILWTEPRGTLISLDLFHFLFICQHVNQLQLCAHAHLNNPWMHFTCLWV